MHATKLEFFSCASVSLSGDMQKGKRRKAKTIFGENPTKPRGLS